jgi:hypothetical protein
VREAEIEKQDMHVELGGNILERLLHEGLRWEWRDDTKMDVFVIGSVLRSCPVELMVLSLRTLQMDTLNMIRLRPLTSLHRYSCSSARNANDVPCFSRVSCNPSGSTGLLNLLTWGQAVT